MVFDARAVAKEASADHPPFPFIDMDGKQHELPNPMLMPTDKLQKFQEVAIAAETIDGAVDPEGAATAFDAYVESVAELFGAELAAVLAGMPTMVMAQLIREWFDGSDDEGKSPSPPSGPNRAARRSKPTTPRKAATKKRTGGRARSTK